jgi:hypothetical protein
MVGLGNERLTRNPLDLWGGRDFFPDRVDFIASLGKSIELL